ncbi:PBECR4 domain-containing protein [Cetobacterium sp. ZOR0034]|uniref:PBECR4 domain-containing protein n=1 Tax=Cetobacterium sp. ZOR0034 TaxID=1339239 RepID=UPI0006460475|nr:PBECR4 domain-containing protein [Cetobacterium sp. ZOR0034]
MNTNINKKDILKKLKVALNNYETFLKNKDFIIIYKDNSNNFIFKRMIFLKKNFFHLTGLKSHLKAEVFYNHLKNGTLGLADFNLKSDGTTRLKLDVLESFHFLLSSECEIGEYDSNNYKNIRLMSHTVLGKKITCLGFIRSNTCYYPNTLLKENLKQITISTNKVITILKKSLENKDYSINFLNKNYTQVDLEIILNSSESKITIEKVD